jgi:hypothetical protein
MCNLKFFCGDEIAYRIGFPRGIKPYVYLVFRIGEGSGGSG